MPNIRIAIAGVGNCASALVQGIFYYKDVSSNEESTPGLMHNVLGGYKISDIEPVAAFDIDARKVGTDLSKAIFSQPNCAHIFHDNIQNLGVEVMKGPVLDGMASHMNDYPQDKTFKMSQEKPVDVAEVLKESSADMLINYLPVGSEEAVRYYADACLEAGVALVNCMPVFIASNVGWNEKFARAQLPVVGDDIKSQVGATIVHRTLAKLFADRGVKIDRTYQLNVGGNCDFLNMLARDRLVSKKISKTQSVQSILPVALERENIHIGPSDYVSWLNDKKIAFIRIEGRKFGNVPIELELRLAVEDSPNSAGSAIDAIRCCKLALDRGISGALTSISAYTMKSPPQQFPDNIAKQMVEEFIKGGRER